jgi:glutaredoxin
LSYFQEMVSPIVYLQTTPTNRFLTAFNIGCPYCVEAVNALKTAGHDIKVVKATRDQREVLYDMTNVGSIPSIWVKGKFVGGCNDGPEAWMGIKKMIKSGKLNEMLN